MLSAKSQPNSYFGNGLNDKRAAYLAPNSGSLQKPVEGLSPLVFSATNNMLKNRQQPTSKNSTYLKGMEYSLRALD